MWNAEILLLDKLLAHEWIELKAMPVQSSTDRLLDVVVSTKDVSCCFTGKAHVLRDDYDEVFSIALFEHDDQQWWSHRTVNSHFWKPRDLIPDLRKVGLLELMEPPRTLQYFTTKRFKQRRDAPSALLDNCCAIEFSKVVNDCVTRMLIMASEVPCEVELVCEPSQIEVRTGALQRLHIPT